MYDGGEKKWEAKSVSLFFTCCSEDVRLRGGGVAAINLDWISG